MSTYFPKLAEIVRKDPRYTYEAYQFVQEALKKSPAGVDRDFLLETLVMHMPQENYEKVFQTFIRWARFGNLFAYDENTQMILPQE